MDGKSFAIGAGVGVLGALLLLAASKVIFPIIVVALIILLAVFLWGGRGSSAR